jgi:hypothetical protein
VERAVEGRVVAEEKFHHFNALYKGMRLELKEAKAKAADYLHQLSFASRVRDSAWADGLHLGFETFRTWWRDPARKMNLVAPQILIVLFLIYLFDNIIQLISLRILWYYGRW